MNRTALIIPALCGRVDRPLVTQALAHITHRDLQDWEQHNIPFTLRKRRRT
jgi:hypothetical protein